MIERLLRDATRRQRRSTAIAIGLAMVAALAGVALLALSGWFLTGAALAGAGGVASARAFNYLLPSAGIRGLAIARTLSRYGERLFGHRAALLALADLRPALFARLAASDPSLSLARSSGDMAARLGSDVDALEDSVVRKVTVPGALAGAVAGLIAASLAGWPAALTLLAGLATMRLSSRMLTPRLLAQPRQEHAAALNRLKADYASYAACSGEIAVYGLGTQVIVALEPHTRALDTARGDISAHAPRIVSIKIRQDKIRDIIGPGGKVIRGIVEETGCKIDIEDDGTVFIASSEEAGMKRAIEIIEGITMEAQVGKIYKGKVVRIVDFGAFVEIMPGTDGLLHISQIGPGRVHRVSDVLKEGDEIQVKVLEIDKSGKIRLSRKEAMAETGQPAGGE